MEKGGVPCICMLMHAAAYDEGYVVHVLLCDASRLIHNRQ